MKIGFIGLGIMGKPMASHLVKSGFSVFVNDINQVAIEELMNLGASRLTNQVIRECDAIITMLPNAEIVKTVILNGEDALINALKEGQFVIDMSSLSPEDSIYIGKQLSSKNINFADAPVSGGEPLAKTGELSVMVGCDEEHFNTVKSFIYPMSKSIVRIGKIGSGSLVKLANQIIVNANIVALSEAVVLAKYYKVDLNQMFEAIRYGLAGSQVMEAKFPKMIADDYRPGGTIEINYKDLNNVISASEAKGLTLPLIKQVREMYKIEIEKGNGKNDHSGIIQYIERLNGKE